MEQICAALDVCEDSNDSAWRRVPFASGRSAASSETPGSPLRLTLPIKEDDSPAPDVEEVEESSMEPGDAPPLSPFCVSRGSCFAMGECVCAQREEMRRAERVCVAPQFCAEFGECVCEEMRVAKVREKVAQRTDMHADGCIKKELPARK